RAWILLRRTSLRLAAEPVTAPVVEKKKAQLEPSFFWLRTSRILSTIDKFVFAGITAAARHALRPPSGAGTPAGARAPPALAPLPPCGAGAPAGARSRLPQRSASSQAPPRARASSARAPPQAARETKPRSPPRPPASPRPASPAPSSHTQAETSGTPRTSPPE